MFCGISSESVEFDIQDRHLRRESEQVCGVYRIRPCPGVKITVEAGRGDFPDAVRIDACSGSYRAATPEFHTSLDLATGTGSMRLAQASTACFMKAVKNLAYFFAMKNRGVVLHACGVVRHDRAYIFTGPSGRGKSTVARLSPECAVLSQECIALLPSAHVPSGDRHMVAWGLPYDDDREFPVRRPSCERIAALFTLVQDDRVFMRPLARSEALAQTLVCPHGDFMTLCGAEHYMDVMSNLFEEVPCYELHFRRDGSFWRCIDEQCAEVSV